MPPNQEEVPKEHHVHRTGHWMPADHRVHKDFMQTIIDHVDQNPTDLHPVIQEFKELIDNNTRLYLLFNSMFEEVPKKKPYNDDPTGHPQIRDHQHMLEILNHLMTRAPEWSDKAHQTGMVGLPINAIFDWPMGTPSGFAVFLDPDVNKMLKKVLDAWGKFLDTEESAYVLDDNSSSWLGQTGSKDLVEVANVGSSDYSAFDQIFECDPTKPHHGFKSWDHFFTRLFKEGVRPVAEPDNNKVIANACESQPYNLAYDVRPRDRFWIKGQPYSLLDMLAQDELSEKFFGGTIYQAFLSALSYHRWHAPVSGKVVKAYVVPGTYYSEPLIEGIGDPQKHDINMSGTTDAQGYILHTATRAIIFIEADEPAIGLMCFLGVGMSEVSTCEITVQEGQHVKKGDQIGMFHYGGSTHCLIFRKEVNVKGFPSPDLQRNVPIRSQVAFVE